MIQQTNIQHSLGTLYCEILRTFQLVKMLVIFSWAGALNYILHNLYLTSMSEYVQTFRAITNDFKISDQEITKYLGWGKGDLQVALNYYYTKKDKEPKLTSTSSFNQSSNDAFSKMRNASIKQNKTQKFIKQVREEYKLPIKRNSQLKESQRNNKTHEEDEMLIQQDGQFAEADYLPEAFGLHNENIGLKQQRERVSLKNMTEQKSQKKYIYQQSQLEGNSVQFNEIEEKQREQISKSKTKLLPKVSFDDKRYEQKINQKTILIQSMKDNDSNRFGWVEGQTEVYVGSCILSGFAIKFENNLNIPEGSHIEFKYFIQEEKKKKGFKSKKVDKSMNIRLLYKGSQLGRLKDDQAKIFVPLIVHGMIRLQLYCHFIPHRIDYYTAIKLNARVHLSKKAITDPVVQSFEGHSDMIVSTYKPVADEILALFQILQVKIKRWPLIKRKSKLKTRSSQQQHTILKQQNKIFEDQTQKSKQMQREQRMRNDPFFRSVQKNLTDLIKFTSKQENSNSVREIKESSSAVKKKIIEVKNIDEDKCSQLVDLYEEDLQPHQASSNFVSSLYRYQALALAWMIQRQGQKSIKNDKDQLHPLWTEYSISSDRSLFVNELTSQLSLKAPYTKSKCLGGILADQMGLGKTVMMAALLATHRQNKRQKREGGNLVIVPLTLLSQWYNQIERHTKGLNTLIYYAQDRKKYENQLYKFDVIITTYGTVSHQYSRGMHVSKLGLYRFTWQRIILDQAHYIKGRIIQTAKAVYELQGLFRWCLTGTPIQNGLEDLFSLIHFIRYTPWSQWQCWKKYILSPAENGEEEVYEVLKTILKRVFLRRTKQSKDHEGKCIVDLPPRISKIQLLQMNKAESQYYNNLYDSSKKKIEQLQKLGILQTKYMQVLQLLMRLRQICCHPLLYKSVPKYTTNLTQFQRELRRFINKKTAEYTSQSQERYFQPILQGEEEQRVEVSGYSLLVSQSYMKEILNKIQNKQVQNCVICLNEVQDPVITPCLHIFCKICSIRQIQQCSICSVCRRRLSKDDILPLPRENRFNKNLDEEFFMSSKLLALVEHLRKLKPDDKAVIFSQFLGMLDLIEHQLKIEKLSYVRMEGSTSHKDRTKIVQKFQKDPSVQIFIVSLKTAGVGLNLVAANKVFLVDPWWNPGVEDQAIQRVHRIGQKRSVQIIRLIMDKSIQLRMLELNTDKKVLSQKVLSKEANPSQSKVEKLKYLMTKY